MRSSTWRLEDLRNVILNLGFVGENLHTRQIFDCKKMFDQYPNASVSMTVTPPEGEPYPGTIERDGDLVIWDVRDSDLVAEGDGEIQIVFTQEPHIARSYNAQTHICRSQVPTGSIPSGLDDYITRADQLLDQVEDTFPAGGTTGQVLAKKSDTDYDTEWVDQGGGTEDYDELENRPQIGGVTLTGNKTLHDLGAASEADVEAKYTKPETGIPASDMAAGVIPDPEDLIDDTAGEGDTDKVWSADKSHELLTQINSKVDSSLMKKCELVEIIGTSNKWDKDKATAGFLHTNGNIYTGGAYDNYVYGVSISVNPGDVIRSYYFNGTSGVTLTMERVVTYDEDGVVVPSSGASAVTSFTVPDGIKSIRLTIAKDYNHLAMIIINDATVPSEYIPYREGDAYYQAKAEFIPESIIRQYINDKVDKTGKGQVTAENCEFVNASPNMFDKSTVEVGLLNKSTGAVLPSYTNYVTSDFIEVESSTDYTFSSSASPYIYWVWYTSSKTWISGGEKAIDAEPTKQSPSTAKYIRFSISPDLVNASVQFEKGSTATSYKKYGEEYIRPEYLPPAEMGFVCNIPKKIYALVGYETNIYFENIVEDWTKYKWDVTCTKGMQMERGFRITPVAGDVGSYTLRFFLSIGDYTESFSTTLVVVSDSAGSGVSESLIILGDSTTANSVAVTKLNANLASDVYNLSTIGTKGTTPNSHEGRSGWRFSTYFSNDADNAFYNPTTQTFDASYYFTNSGVAKPDWFFVNLGINDVFSYSSDEDLDAAIGDCKDYLDAMIESINEASPNTKIGICLTIPPNHSQDAFGKEYKCGQNRNRYKRNNTLWVNAVINEYDDREEEGIFLIPIHAVLDTVYNMGFETIPVNARNTAITYESPIGNGGVHPVESGYWQIADQYTAFLKGNASS